MDDHEEFEELLENLIANTEAITNDLQKWNKKAERLFLRSLGVLGGLQELKELKGKPMSKETLQNKWHELLDGKDDEERPNADPRGRFIEMGDHDGTVEN